MKSLKVFLLGMLCINISIAQNETDILRYSNLNYFGTARFMATGGSMSAYGTDMSTITLNPAAQASYKWSEFSFTSNITGKGINTNYNGTSSSDLKANFNISNIGFVLKVKQNPNKITNWRGFQFGYSRTRTNDFVGRTLIKGNSNNSMLYSFANNSHGIKPDDLSAYYEGIVYDAWLLDYDSISEQYNAYTNSTDNDQEKISNTSGHQYANDITFSANYYNKIFIGGSIGFPTIKFNQKSTYTEILNNSSIYDLEDFSFEEELNTSGSGFNAKIGLIFLPVKNIKVGLAVHSSTYYSMTDKFQNRVTSNFVDDDFDSDIPSEEGIYNYDLKTPARYLASFAYAIQKRGFISFEYEYVDYKGGNLSADDYSFSKENKKATEIYKGASNIKLGAEFRVSNNWKLRGGAALYGSPIKSKATVIANTRKNFSGGFGYQTKYFALDFAYLRSIKAESTYLFDPSFTTPVSINKNLNNFVVTAGWRF